MSVNSTLLRANTGRFSSEISISLANFLISGLSNFGARPTATGLISEALGWHTGCLRNPPIVGGI